MKPGEYRSTQPMDGVDEGWYRIAASRRFEGVRAPEVLCDSQRGRKAALWAMALGVAYLLAHVVLWIIR